jgi:hypothetical protein
LKYKNESTVKSPTKEIKPIGPRSIVKNNTTTACCGDKLSGALREAARREPTEHVGFEKAEPEHNREQSTRAPRALVSRSGVERDEHGRCGLERQFPGLISVEFLQGM